MLSNQRLLSVAQELPEVRVLHHGREGCAALIENPSTVGDEKQRQSPTMDVAEPAVVERGHNGLARAGGCDEEIAMAVMALTLNV